MKREHGGEGRSGRMRADPAVVRAAQRGDSVALRDLVAMAERPLYVTALAILGSHDDAADAFQEAALSIILHIATLREPDYFGTWATRVVVNHALTIRRRKSRVIPLTEGLEARTSARQHVDGFDTQVEDRVDLMRALAVLDPDHRAVVALRYLHDLQLASIADVLDIPVGTVKSRLHHALRRLRAQMSRPHRKDGVR